jgi:thiol-disulfide isomerase/thioredoxin
MKAILIIVFLFVAANMNAQQVRSVKATELERTIKESKTPLIVNFWATFCVPCLQEIPYFQELAEKYKPKGVSILFVSLDLQKAYPDSIIKTAGKHNIFEPIVWLNETNADYFCPKIDSSWTGGMPSSLFVNNATGYHKFFEEPLSKDGLEKEILAMLGEGKTH